MTIDTARWIPWLPAMAAALWGMCCWKRSLRSLAAPVCIGSLAAAFVMTCCFYGQVIDDAAVSRIEIQRIAESLVVARWLMAR